MRFVVQAAHAPLGTLLGAIFAKSSVRYEALEPMTNVVDYDTGVKGFSLDELLNDLKLKFGAVAEPYPARGTPWSYRVRLDRGLPLGEGGVRIVKSGEVWYAKAKANAAPLSLLLRGWADVAEEKPVHLEAAGVQAADLDVVAETPNDLLDAIVQAVGLTKTNTAGILHVAKSKPVRATWTLTFVGEDGVDRVALEGLFCG